jgi:hypothetical protein
MREKRHIREVYLILGVLITIWVGLNFDKSTAAKVVGAAILIAFLVVRGSYPDYGKRN